jgi:hypothetical protein
MAVVIDEMQVEPAAPPQARGGQGGGGADGEGKQEPAPEEFARAFEQQRERYERVRAY